MSPTGNDSNSGTSGTPVATLEAAANLVQNWRNNAGNNTNCNAPVMVWIAGGSYFRNSSFNLSNYNMNGTTACPTIFSGTTSGIPSVLTGSIVVNDSGFTPLTDPNIIQRFQNVHGNSWVNNIYTLNLNTYTTNFGDLNGLNGGQYSPMYAPMEIIYNGAPLTLSRYPYPAQYPTDGTAWPATFSPGQIRITSTNGSTTVGYSSIAEPGTWTQPSNSSNNQIWTHARYLWDWDDSHFSVSPGSISTTGFTLSGAGTGVTGPDNIGTYDQTRAGWFYFENILEEVNLPGEYYIDRDTGILYVYPPDGTNITSGTDDIELTMSTNAMVTSNTGSYVNNIIFQNLTFQNMRGDAFYLQNVNNVVLANSIIKNTGGSAFFVTGYMWALGAGNAGQNSQVGVYHSHLYNTGSWGINIGTVDPTASDGGGPILTGDRDFAVDNKVHNGGRWSNNVGAGYYLITLMGNSPYISHNEVYDHDNGGILMYPPTNGIVEYNNVHDTNKLNNDGGAIYVGGRTLLLRGNVLKYNFVHDIYGVPDNQSAEGMYCDDTNPDCYYYGNILDTIAPNRGYNYGNSNLSLDGRWGGAFMIGGGRNVKIENNIINNAYTVVLLGEWDGEGKIPAEQASFNSGYLSTPPYSTYFPEGDQSFTVESPDGTIIKNNISFYNPASQFFLDSYPGQFWDPYVQGLQGSANLLNGNPSIMDSNYQIQPSAIENMDFQQIPFASIGLIDPSSPTFSTTSLLTVSLSGNGNGEVFSSDSIINCGVNLPPPPNNCSDTVNTGTVVTLTATPATGSVFSGWSGACSGMGSCTVAMNAAQSVTASFTADSKNGICGTANQTYLYTETSFGSNTLCKVGSPDPAIVAFPMPGSLVRWICEGSYNGLNSTCKAQRNNRFIVKL